MSSVRNRVEEFEKLSTEKGNNVQTTGHKKFLYPGSKQREAPPRKSDAPTRLPQASASTKPSFESEFECELQEVWSVRKNVHHTALTRTNNEIITANHNEPTRVYSRHKQGGQINSRSLPDKARRFPLHDHNHHSELTGQRLDNSRTPFQSYCDNTSKRLHHSPSGDSPPTLKRKVEAPLFKSSDANGGPQHWLQSPETKVSYAKKMAQAHMKSVGIGSYTPKLDAYKQKNDQGQVHWQKHDADDEFSF